MNVRRAGDGDGPRLADLRWAWRVQELGEPSTQPYDQFADAFSAWFDAHRDSHLAWLATDATDETDDSQAVGMVFLAIVERPPGPATPRRVAGGLQSLYVLPGCRGTGYGGALIQAVLDEARHRGLAYVFLHPTDRSIPLYRRFGFENTGRTFEVNLDRR